MEWELNGDKKLYVPKNTGAIKGLVSDIKVFDKGKLVDYHPGGENTISSGASFDLLQSAFEMTATASQGGGVRYQDANNNYFPNLNDLYGWSAMTNSGAIPSYYAPAYHLFSQVIGLNGGSGGLPSHVTSLPGLKAGWWLGAPTASTASNDWGSSSFFSSKNNTYITPSTTYSRASNQSTNSGVPYVSWNITVTSASNAQAYTIDSIGWIPGVIARATSGGSYTSNGVYSGYWNVSSTTPLSFTSTIPTQASASATPTTFSTYLSALFVLPYLVTVNPGGAFQFTYTFQGS